MDQPSTGVGDSSSTQVPALEQHIPLAVHVVSITPKPIGRGFESISVSTQVSTQVETNRLMLLCRKLDTVETFVKKMQAYGKKNKLRFVKIELTVPKDNTDETPSLFAQRYPTEGALFGSNIASNRFHTLSLDSKNDAPLELIQQYQPIRVVFETIQKRKLNVRPFSLSSSEKTQSAPKKQKKSTRTKAEAALSASLLSLDAQTTNAKLSDGVEQQGPTPLPVFVNDADVSSDSPAVDAPPTTVV